MFRSIHGEDEYSSRMGTVNIVLHSSSFVQTSAASCPGLKVQCSIKDAQELIRLKIVRPVAPSDAHRLLSTEGYKLLDVRPVWEWERASVAGSHHIPLFVEDEDDSYMTLFKKSIQQGYGGVWMGQRLTKRNEQFLEQVQALFPEKDEKIVVACGEGLRSQLALDELHDDGYTNLAWIDGGFSRCQDDSFPDVQGSIKLQFASIGGAAEYLVKAILLAQSIITKIVGTGTTK